MNICFNVFYTFMRNYTLTFIHCNNYVIKQNTHLKLITEDSVVRFLSTIL